MTFGIKETTTLKLHCIKFEGKKKSYYKKQISRHLLKLEEILENNETEHCILAQNMTFVSSRLSFRSPKGEHKKFVDSLADILSNVVKR